MRSSEGQLLAVDAATSRLDTDELFARWHEHGDRHARAELIERFLPLARKLARRYVGAHEPIDDLVQVASVGLVGAVDRYRPDRGTAFTSFAVPTILGELKRYFRDYGWSVHVPRGTQELALKVENAQRELTSQATSPPTVQEVAEYLELEVEQVLDALEAAGAHHTASLDASRDDDDEESATLVESLGVEDDRFELIDGTLTIAAVVDRLSSRERTVLTLRFVHELTQSQIAERIGVSQMQVSRILRRALDSLRELTDADGLQP
jgi:RNA polymerase sigma-B factor